MGAGAVDDWRARSAALGVTPAASRAAARPESRRSEGAVNGRHGFQRVWAASNRQMAPHAKARWQGREGGRAGRARRGPWQRLHVGAAPLPTCGSCGIGAGEAVGQVPPPEAVASRQGAHKARASARCEANGASRSCARSNGTRDPCANDGTRVSALARGRQCAEYGAAPGDALAHDPARLLWVSSRTRWWLLRPRNGVVTRKRGLIWPAPFRVCGGAEMNAASHDGHVSSISCRSRLDAPGWVPLQASTSRSGAARAERPSATAAHASCSVSSAHPRPWCGWWAKHGHADLLLAMEHPDLLTPLLAQRLAQRPFRPRDRHPGQAAIQPPRPQVGRGLLRHRCSPALPGHRPTPPVGPLALHTHPQHDTIRARPRCRCQPKRGPV